VSTAQDFPAQPAPLLDTAPYLRLVAAPELDFEAAVRSVRPRLHRYATRRLGDEHEAEELVQEALLRAYSHRDKLQTEEDLAAWSTVVTGRLVIDRLRVRNRSYTVAEVPESGRVGRDTADVVVGRDEARTALDALDAMPARQAALLWAREVEGDSYEELCVRFNMSEPAVRSILTRARKSLRREYATRGGTLPVAGLAVLAPWLAGITWANRARQLAHRMTGPAALATVGITALGSLVLAPFGSGNAPTTFRPSTAVVSGSAPANVVPAAVTKQVRRVSARKTVASVPAATPPKLIDATDGIGCTPGSAVRSASCAPGVKGAFLSLVPSLPSNPVVHRQIGLSFTEYDCQGWKPNPLIACTPGGADR
jgi:RNA polymerase sigma-70 factor (ECF subfamily)